MTEDLSHVHCYETADVYRHIFTVIHCGVFVSLSLLMCKVGLLWCIEEFWPDTFLRWVTCLNLPCSDFLLL